ncbi:MAG: MFS transporter [Chitinophagaceae bacterium]|nr:MFS transporter [Chitinophagaceae bacterium]
MVRNYIQKVYGGISLEIWILASAMLINRCGSMVLVFLNVYLVKEKHLSISESGLILSLYGLGSLAGAYVGGKLVDAIGFYPILFLSLFCTGTSIIVLGQASTFETIAPLAFLVTFFADSFRPANSASITNYSKKEDYTRSIALNRLAMNIGFFISPTLGGVLATKSYQWLFWVDGITSILAGVFIVVFLKKPLVSLVSKLKNSAVTKMNPYKDVTYLKFILFVTLYATLFFQFFTSFPLFFKESYQYSEKKIGMIMAINGLGVALIEMFLIHYIQNRWTKFKFMGLGSLLLLGSFAVYLFPQHLSVVLVSILLITFSEMFAIPFMSTYAMSSAPPDSIGRYSALYSMAWSLALIISPLIGSGIIDHFGFQVLWIVLAVLGFVSFLGFRYLDKLSTKANL